MIGQRNKMLATASAVILVLGLFALFQIKLSNASTATITDLSVSSKYSSQPTKFIATVGNGAYIIFGDNNTGTFTNITSYPIFYADEENYNQLFTSAWTSQSFQVCSNCTLTQLNLRLTGPTTNSSISTYILYSSNDKPLWTTTLASNTTTYSLTSGYLWYSFQYSSTNLTAGVNYCIVVYCTDSAFALLVNSNINYDYPYGEVGFSTDNVTWSNSDGTDDFAFQVIGTTVPALYTAMISDTVNDTAGNTVSYEFWINDSSGSWVNTGLQSFTVLSGSSLIGHLAYLSNNVVNWNSDVFSCYSAYQFGQCTLEQLQNAIDNIRYNSSLSYYNWIDTTMAQQWQAVLYWYLTAQKYGITNQTTIEWALDNATIMSNGLPASSGNIADPYFALNHRYELFGCYYSNLYSYETSKWNITQAYASFKSATSSGSNPGGFVYSDSSCSGSGRYYDEYAETMDCYTDFYVMGMTGALNCAVTAYNYNIKTHWDTNSSSFGSYFAYTDLSTGLFECEGGGFLQLCEKLNYYNMGLPNATYITTDLETRFLSQEWNSPQWISSPQGIVIHAAKPDGTPSNGQYRLQNTLMAWSAIYGVYSALPSSYLNTIQNMLLGGNTSSYPAWTLVYNGLGGSSGFKWSSYDSSTYDEATLTGMTLMFMLGIVPLSTTLAIPLQENAYEDIANFIDGTLFNISLTTYQLRISLTGSGSVKFIFGDTPVTYNFTNGQGIYTVQFSSDWNNISSVTYNGGLPTNRIYLSNIVVGWTVTFNNNGHQTVYVNGVLTPDGSVQTYTAGTILNITTVPDAGYTFQNFTYGSGNTSTINPFTYTVPNSVDAVTSYTLPIWTITFNNNGHQTVYVNGTLTVNGSTQTFPAGTTLNITTVPDAGYTFQNFTYGSGNTSTINPFTYTVPNSTDTLTAYVTPILDEVPSFLMLIVVTVILVFEVRRAQRSKKQSSKRALLLVKCD